MEEVFAWVATYGYGAIFILLVLGIVGLPIPDETLLVFCGYLISQGRMRPVAALLWAVAGSWCGISLSYIIGRTVGVTVVHKYGRYFGLTEKRMVQVNEWFNRIGHWALFVGYYIAGVRHFTAITAGMSGLRFRSFAAYAWPGGLLWVSTFLTLGYFIGERWREIAEAVHRYGLYVSVIVLTAAILYGFLLRTLGNRRQGNGR